MDKPQSESPKPKKRNSRVQSSDKYLLAPQSRENEGKKTLVLDIDETLVHSCFEPVDNADYVVNVEFEENILDVYILKRPHVDEFIEEMSKYYEIVYFTASLEAYANPLLDQLDKKNYGSARLFRDSCVYQRGSYIKPLCKLGRDLKKTIIVDNSPVAYSRNRENAIPIESWYSDSSDKDLLELIPILISLSEVPDVTSVIKKAMKTPRINPYESVPTQKDMIISYIQGEEKKKESEKREENGGIVIKLSNGSNEEFSSGEGKRLPYTFPSQIIVKPRTCTEESRNSVKSIETRSLPTTLCADPTIIPSHRSKAYPEEKNNSDQDRVDTLVQAYPKSLTFKKESIQAINISNLETESSPIVINDFIREKRVITFFNSSECNNKNEGIDFNDSFTCKDLNSSQVKELSTYSQQKGGKLSKSNQLLALPALHEYEMEANIELITEFECSFH